MIYAKLMHSTEFTEDDCTRHFVGRYDFISITVTNAEGYVIFLVALQEQQNGLRGSSVSLRTLHLKRPANKTSDIRCRFDTSKRAAAQL